MGILALIFAAFIVWQTGKVNLSLVSNEPGPRFFPYISAAGVAIFAILSMIFDGLKESKCYFCKICMAKPPNSPSK